MHVATEVGVPQLQPTPSPRKRSRDPVEAAAEPAGSRFLPAAITAHDTSNELEEAFLRSFPGAEVERCNDKTIQPVPFEDVWLAEPDQPGATAEGPNSPSPSFQERAVWVIAAHKGMGKSKAIRASVRDLAELCDCAGMRRPTVLNVTFRRSLARGAASDFPGGTVYLDEEDAHLDAARHPVLTILINSLARVRAVRSGQSYEVVILDEWVSILEMLGGNLVDGELRLEILRRLADVLRLARAVVVSDALLDEAALRVLANLLEWSGGGGGEGEGEDSRRSPPTTHVTLVHYTHPIHADHTFHAYESEEEWEQQLLAAAAGRSSGAIVVPCMTKAAALRLSDRIRRACPSRRVLVYVAGGERDVQQDMEQIQRVWSEADVLIYSPVITAGCSFEVRGHFSECFLYAFQGTASPRSALQMVFRVRDLAARRIHVWVARGQDGWGDAEAALRQVMASSAEPPTSDLLRIHDATMLCHALREVERNQCFTLTFWRLVNQTSARVARGRPGAASPHAPEEAAEQEVAQLEIVRKLTANAAYWLRSRQTAVLATRDWQLDDFERCGVLQWSGPPEFEAAAPSVPSFAQEYPPDEWHVLFLRRLVVQGGWSGGGDHSWRPPAAETPRPIDLAVREAVASVLVLGSLRGLISRTLARLAPDSVRWLPGHDSLLQPLFVGVEAAEGSGAATVLYVHAQGCRMTLNDVESDVVVRAVFGWAVADLMRQMPPVESVRCIIASADASSVWRADFKPKVGPSSELLRCARSSNFILESFFDFERCRPVPLRVWNLEDHAVTFDPAAHVSHIRAGEAGGAQVPMAERYGAEEPSEVGAPSGQSRVFAIRPVDPTARPKFGGSWSDPRSMLQALLHNRASHALLFETPDAEPVAVRCRPVTGVAALME